MKTNGGYVMLIGSLMVGCAWGYSMAHAARCTAPDNGSSTVALPAECPYVNEAGTLNIIDGLPPGTSIESHFHVDSFFDVFVGAGGSLGGQVIEFEAAIHLQMTGTGDLAGFSRELDLPVYIEMHTAPRVPGAPIQRFECDLWRLTSVLTTVDPDFNSLSLTAGTDEGLPSPGSTTLTRLPNGNWNVDSFFDVTFKVTFAGVPGSALDGYSGVTTEMVKVRQGEDGWDHCDSFFIQLDSMGGMAAGGGNGYDDGAWYYYPNTGWWNQWYYDGLLDLARTKNILLIVNVVPDGPLADVTIAANYSSSTYLENLGHPPIPPLSPGNEEEWIVRDIVFVENHLTEGLSMEVLVPILDFNPEWVSIDVMGTNVMIEGVICHSCLPGEEEEGEGEPPIEGEGEPPVEGEGEPPNEGEGEMPIEGINITVQNGATGLPGTDINSPADGDSDPLNDVYKAGGCTNRMRLRHRLLGLQPTDDINAIAYPTSMVALGSLDDHGMFDYQLRPIFWHFSVDQNAQGVGGSAVNNEVTVGTSTCTVIAMPPEAHGDIFVTSNALGNINSNALAADESELGLVAQASNDNLNGLDIHAPLIDRLNPPPGQYLQPGDIFFSLEAGAPSLGLAGVSAADILTPDGAGFFRVATTADGLLVNGDHVTLGIPVDNDLDALFVDKNGLPLYSVAQMILAMPPIGTGDVLVPDGLLLPPPDGFADVLIPASMLGLQPAGDNLNALDATLWQFFAGWAPELGEDVALFDEGEGELPDEGEGELPDEGEGELPDEGEGELPDEGEGELPEEGEGEPLGLRVYRVGKAVVRKTEHDHITFSIRVEGAQGPLAYQWHCNKPEKSWTAIPNAHEESYTILNITEADAGEYRCEVTDTVDTAWSPIFKLIVSEPLPASSLLMLFLLVTIAGVSGMHAIRKNR